MMLSEYDWQREARTIFLEEKKLVVEVPTGAGKTFFAVECIRSLLEKDKNLKFLIVVPKIVIMSTWHKELSKHFSVMDLGFYYGETKDYAKIMITTTSSIKNICLEIFDVLIVDEVHNSFVPKFRRIYSERNWKNVLGLTATIASSDSTKHWSYMKYFDYNVFSFSMKSALDQDIINKFNFHNYSVEIKEPKIKAKYEEIQLNINKIITMCGSFAKMMNNLKYKAIFQSLIDKRNKLIYSYNRKFLMLNNILLQNKDKKIIIFNQYNEISRDIYLQCLDNDLSARVVNSDLDKETVKKYIKDFENNVYNILITSKMFDEGYNLPALDIAIIFSGDSTTRQTIQRMGRVLRKKDDYSNIYQIYVRGTFEEEYANKRYLLVKDLCEQCFTEVI